MSEAIPQYALWMLLGAVVLPLWLAAGLCDYTAHARTRIEETSGVHESVLHLLQTAQIGVPLLAVVLLEVNAGVLSLATAGVAAHSVTAYRDLRYTAPRRHVSVFEQYVHGFLIVLPLVALALVVLLHWPAVAALWRGDARWEVYWKQPSLDARIVTGVLLACLLLGVLPGVYEFVRTWRFQRGRR